MQSYMVAEPGPTLGKGGWGGGCMGEGCDWGMGGWGMDPWSGGSGGWGMPMDPWSMSGNQVARNPENTVLDA